LQPESQYISYAWDELDWKRFAWGCDPSPEVVLLPTLVGSVGFVAVQDDYGCA